MKRKVYALYKGEDLVEMGTAKHIAEVLGITESSVLFYQSPSYRKRTSEERGKRLIRLEGEFEDE